AIASGRSGEHSAWPVIDLDAHELLAPVATAGKIIAVGLNYVDHTAETGFAQPERPLTFAKYTTSLTGPFSDVVVPDHIAQGVDFEAE
ncbi:fumarylacetoacetate hydrolase family protein, partial [Streptococcus pneumoniae]|nr:fumarylacetoacetate hydrolase family protein [Streptococcus pneumoniae]